MIEHLRLLFQRDLGGVTKEIELYPDDAAPWVEIPGQPNSGGTLALHLAGNLRHFIGAKLGGSGYVRQREEEFSRRGVPRKELVALIEATQTEVDAALATLDPARLEDLYEIPNGQAVSTLRFLLHLALHLTYHLGQLDYHRRAVTGDKSAAGTIPLAALNP